MSADPYSTGLEDFAQEWKYRELMRMRLSDPRSLARPMMLMSERPTLRQLKEGELRRRVRCRMAGIDPGPVGAGIWPLEPVRSRHYGGSGGT